jgi:hypothetical protein
VTGALTAQQGDVASGSWAARATSPNPSGAPTAAYASETLAASQTDLYYRMPFKLLSAPTAGTYLGKFRTEANAAILGCYVSNTGKLSFRNDAGVVTRYSSQSVTTGQWHEAHVHLTVDVAYRAAGQIEVWYDGMRLADLSTAQNLGIDPVGRLQIGENDPTKTFDVVFDDVVADSSFIESKLSLSTTTWGGVSPVG